MQSSRADVLSPPVRPKRQTHLPRYLEDYEVDLHNLLGSKKYSAPLASAAQHRHGREEQWHSHQIVADAMTPSTYPDAFPSVNTLGQMTTTGEWDAFEDIQRAQGRYASYTP